MNRFDYIDRNYIRPKSYWPSFITPNGDKYWFKDDKFSEHGGKQKAFHVYAPGENTIEIIDGGELFWLIGILHRANGPAIEAHNGEKQYWVDGKIIRVENK